MHKLFLKEVILIYGKRRFSISRKQTKYGTHQLDGHDNSIYEISDTDWKEKVKSETFEYRQQNMAVLNQLLLIFFMIEI